MKLKNFSFLLYVIFLISCGKKIDLTTEVFNFSTYKATIEQAYADSPNNQNQEILLNFINDNLQGIIDKKSIYCIIDTNGVLKEDSTITYASMLNVYAKPYSDWKKNMSEYNTKLASTLDINLIDILLQPYSDTIAILSGTRKKINPQFEIQNKSDNDIVSIEFSLSLTNKSREELFFQNFEYLEKIKKGTSKKFIQIAPEIEKVANMDLNLITKYFTVTNVSFVDGTTLIRPKESINE
jgi:hypothetical protein